MRICVAGAYGAFGLKHLDALKNIEDIEGVSVMGPNKDKIAALASERHIKHFSDSLEAVSYTHLTLPTICSV